MAQTTPVGDWEPAAPSWASVADADSVAHLAIGMGDYDPRYQRATASGEVPTLFPIVGAGLPITTPDGDVAVWRAFAAEFRRPLSLGEATAARRRSHVDGATLRTDVEVLGADGSVVATAIVSAVAASARPADPPRRRTRYPDDTVEAVEAALLAETFAPRFAPGFEPFQAVRGPLGPWDIGFAIAASGFEWPVGDTWDSPASAYFDEPPAHRLGLAGIPAPGVLQLGWAVSAVTRVTGATPIRAIRAEFPRPVVRGDLVTTTVSPAEHDPAVVSFSSINQLGDVVTTGTITVAGNEEGMR